MQNRTIRTLVLACAVALGAAPAGAAPIAIGGVDAQSQYTYSAGVGVLTFFDTVNGSNPAPEAGTVTTTGVPGQVPAGSRILFEGMLDTSAFNPAAGLAIDARFIGTGPGAELTIWDSTQSTVLLAFDLDFLDVTTVLPSTTASQIILGNNNVADLNVTSRFVLVGGTQAAAVGGIGTEAVLKLVLNRPLPQISVANLFTYWSNPLMTVGVGANPPLSAVNWDLLIVPEPGVGTLLVLGLAGLAYGGRRRQS